MNCLFLFFQLFGVAIVIHDSWHIVQLIFTVLILWMYALESYGSIVICVMECRKKGRSYLGVIDEVQSSMSTVDIPFTYLTNIVCLILTFLFH